MVPETKKVFTFHELLSSTAIPLTTLTMSETPKIAQEELSDQKFPNSGKNSKRKDYVLST